MNHIKLIFSMLKQLDKKHIKSNINTVILTLDIRFFEHMRIKLNVGLPIFALFSTVFGSYSIKNYSKMTAFNKYHGLRESTRDATLPNAQSKSIFFSDVSKQKIDTADAKKIVRILIAGNPRNHKNDQKRRQAIYLRHFLF